MTIRDLLTLLSFIALAVAIVLQMKRIYRTKSSHDFSLVGMGIRYAANAIILIKVIQISELMLTLGQGLIVVTYTAYFALAFYYSKHPLKAGDKSNLVP